MSTDKDRNANRYPLGENDDNAVTWVVSSTAGREIAAVETGRPLGGLGVLFLFFLSITDAASWTALVLALQSSKFFTCAGSRDPITYWESDGESRSGGGEHSIVHAVSLLSVLCLPLHTWLQFLCI